MSPQPLLVQWEGLSTNQMETPSESNGALDVIQAGNVLSNLMEPTDEGPVIDTEIDVTPPKEEKPEVTEAVDEAEQTVTIKVDGKTVELTQEQLADAYKNGLRQADYTKKTMEAAELRKSAESERARAFQERQQYAENLNRIAVQLEGVLQNQPDLSALLESDPVEYLKQTHLLQQRQAQLNQVYQQRQALAEQARAEQANAFQNHLQQQQQELLAKLPTWKDSEKAAAEREALKAYLRKEGYQDQDIGGINDHRAVVMARKAMLYDQMISKASAAAKKVAPLPQKVERPGVNEVPQTDKRTAAYQRLSKSGRVEDAAAIFASIL